MYYSVCYINILITMFLMTFRWFPTTIRRFPKIFQNCSEGLVKVSEHFPNIFRRLPKVADDFRGGTDDVSIIQHHLWVLFKLLCSYCNGNLKNIVFSHCENIWIFSVAMLVKQDQCVEKSYIYVKFPYLCPNYNIYVQIAIYRYIQIVIFVSKW